MITDHRRQESALRKIHISFSLPTVELSLELILEQRVSGKDSQPTQLYVLAVSIQDVYADTCLIDYACFSTSDFGGFSHYM